MEHIEEQLKGSAWRLESYQSEDKNGEVIYPLGKGATGTILFSTSNFLSVQIMAANELDSKETHEIAFNTENEKEMSRLGYHAYSGSFEINEEERLLTTSVEISLLSDYIGSRQTRKVDLKENKLHLSNIKHPERKLVWTRIEASSSSADQ